MKNNNIKYAFTAALMLFMATSIIAQNKYIDKKGKVLFEASEKAFEPVKAANESVTAILNTANGEIAALALMKSFRFRNSLMEEHFNENYVESETYPKAIFKGKLLDFDVAQLSESEQEVTLKGTMEMHGKSKEINTILKIKMVNGAIKIDGMFIVTPDDFDIEIPSVVKDKIAKNIEVIIDFNLAKR